MQEVYGQGAYAVRLDWGPVGAAACGADVGVVVDVLSFSTTVTVAVELGTLVYPCPWDDDRARALAVRHDATLAVGRLEALRDGAVVAPSLSPAGLLSMEPVERLVLPSPNGSATASALAEAGSTVAAGCLRNARAVARWLARAVDSGRPVAVVAAGERWSQDGSLRPALEDHLGAGAILSHLRSLGYAEQLSPEASAAAGMFDTVAGRLPAALHGCVGGRELASRGFAADVDVAARLDVSWVVPVLQDGAFTAPDEGTGR